MTAPKPWLGSTMRADFQGLRSLASCLVGRFPDDVDWDCVIALANQTMTITSLAAAVHSAEPTGVPDEVRDYLDVIYTSNAKRNAMLHSQLEEAVACLNEAGIEPVIMKGAAVLLSQATPNFGGRILIDLDLMVRPPKMQEAIQALQAIGYDVSIDGGARTWPGDPEAHLPTVLGRGSDAGSIDLHCRPKGPASFKDIEWLYQNSTRSDLGKGHAYIPSGFAQIVYLILHDQFQDGDYWRGLIDLRHLLDIVSIARSADEIDWSGIRSLFAAGYEQNATDTQILTVNALFGIPDIARLKIGILPRFQFLRRKLQLGRGYLRHPLTIAAFLSEIVSYPSWDRYGGISHASRRQELKRVAREFRRVFRPKPLGKA